MVIEGDAAAVDGLAVFGPRQDDLTTSRAPSGVPHGHRTGPLAHTSRRPPRLVCPTDIEQVVWRTPVVEETRGGTASGRPVPSTRWSPRWCGSGCSGAATSAAPLVELVAQRTADEIAERTGVRLEIAAVAVRSLSQGARRRRSPTACSPPTPPTSSPTPAIDVVVEVIGGIEPARELILTALGQRQAGRHRQQGAAGQRRRRAVRRRRRRRQGPAVRGGRRRRHPAHPAAARVASSASASSGCSASSTARPTTSSPR